VSPASRSHTGSGALPSGGASSTLCEAPPFASAAAPGVAPDSQRASLAEARTLERLTDASESSELREQAEGAGLDAICLAFSRASSSLLLAVSAAAKASRTRASSSVDTTRSIAAR